MKKLPPLSISAVETETLDFWQKNQTFNRSLEQSRSGKPFSFYDGPPFANGLPHFGHSLVTAIKDSVGRYKTMQGYYVPRQNGWDCHGLPVEYEIEKKFGISGKKQITELGLDKFNQACRDSVFTYKKDWEEFFTRIGRWTDTEHAYATINTSYIESVWWVLSEVNKKGLLYKGFKSMPYCPRCETPLSNFELNEGYRDNVPDPSLYVKFKLVDEDVYMLTWTTTPWSLPGNAALAVKPGADYVQVSLVDDDGKTEHLILAKARLEVLDAKYSIERTFKGKELVGKSYQALFSLTDIEKNPKLYQIWAADFVSIEDGSGVLHVAPAFGEDDLNLAQTEGLPVLETVDSSGHMSANVGIESLIGLFFKKADREVIEYLTEQNLVYNAEIINHTYPFCYRCDSPLLYYAVSTWFVSVSKIRAEMGKTAEPINWVPPHVKNGRFGKWLDGARDWAISRNRYWGAPLPIWVNEADSSDYILISSVAELKELAEGDPDLSDLHRPGIDKVIIKRDGKTYVRAEEVLDCWFESGSMPYAQNHYPFEDKEEFRTTFPADYIGEGLDQTRLWFYVLHVLSTILFDKPAYKNVIVNGMVVAADGQKLSKRLRNYPPVEDVFTNEGADSLRFYLLSGPASTGEAMRFLRDGLRDVSRNVFATLYNSASFLSLYAEIDDWKASSLTEPANLTNPLDRWLVARVKQTAAQVSAGADSYDLGRATRPLSELVDDLSNWYVRRNRRRLSKNDDTHDKQAAFATLHWTLVTTCQLFAPWAPFMSDHLYRHLCEGVSGAADSVHLTAWPQLGPADQTILDQMAQVRSLITEGLAQRAQAKCKVRQPLATAIYQLPQALDASLEQVMAEELNVKSIKYQQNDLPSLHVDTELTPELKAEGLARDVIRQIQQARKHQDLSVNDHIDLWLHTDTELQTAIKVHQELIASEVLADTFEIHTSNDSTNSETVSVKIDDHQLDIGLKKVTP